LTINFANPIAAPSAFAPNSLLGYLDIDLDTNYMTGGAAPWGGTNQIGGESWMNDFLPPQNGHPAIPASHNELIRLGSELYVDFGSEVNHPGRVDIFETAKNSVVATIPIIYDPTSLSIILPHDTLGNDGLFNYGILVGTFGGLTDRGPNGS